MFTGLVETKGTLVRRTARGDGARLVIRGLLATPDPLALGESIAVDGVCLTVAQIVQPGDKSAASVFEADASAETLKRTTLGSLTEGADVNLERAVKMGARLGGHIVSGHVDGVGRIASSETTDAARSTKVVFEAPSELMRFVAEKGSICVNGVSLTVNGVEGNRFDVTLVPHTREVTSFGALEIGASINLEVDVVARYVARLVDTRSPDSTNDAAWLERLQRAGYM